MCSFLKLFLSMIMIVNMIIISGCTKEEQAINGKFYTYQQTMDEINKMALEYPQILRVHAIGTTAEGRSIVVLELGNTSGKDEKSGLMATFAQHSEEHETTTLGLDFVKYILKNYGKDDNITNVLNAKTIYIVPMVNPDGVEYEFSKGKDSLSWRKNRNMLSENVYGVDLNRNWGYHWDASINKEIDQKANTPNDEYYHGEQAFSEIETKSLSEFITNHKNIKVFVDYHTGESDFMQGVVLSPFSYAEKQEMNTQEVQKYIEVSSALCKLISDKNDKRTPYNSMRAFEVKDFVLKQAPFWQKPLVWLGIPSSTIAPGAAIDWTASQGIVSFGIETTYPNDFIYQMPDSHEILMENQLKGFLFLLSNTE